NIVGTAVTISNNVFENPINAYYESYAVSNACCVWGAIDGSLTDNTLNLSNAVPAVYAENNLFLSPTRPGNIWGYEAWGTGAQYNNNMLQGYICAGFVWAYFGEYLNIGYNIMQGPIMASGSACPNYPPLAGTFIGVDGSNT